MPQQNNLTFFWKGNLYIAAQFRTNPVASPSLLPGLTWHWAAHEAFRPGPAGADAFLFASGRLSSESLPVHAL
jgi:hypothetical protein